MNRQVGQWCDRLRNAASDKENKVKYVCFIKDVPFYENEKLEPLRDDQPNGIVSSIAKSEP